uniref:Uncharacterized protein n=1 Tax=Oryza barthii TaxID=65489 RepID=A0A0D3H5I9_9ORYZ
MAAATDDDEDVEEMQGYRIGRIGSASCKEDRLDQMGSTSFVGTRSRSTAFGGRQRRTVGLVTGASRASQVAVDGDGSLRHSCSIPFVHVRLAGTVPVLGEAHGVIVSQVTTACSGSSPSTLRLTFGLHSTPRRRRYLLPGCLIVATSKTSAGDKMLAIAAV